MRLRSGLVVLGILALLPPDLGAQQAAATPRYWRVTEWESPPAAMSAFRARFTELARMAQTAKAPASSSFQVYTAENRTIVARPADPTDLLAPVNAAIRAAQPEAFQQWAAGNTPATPVRTEIWVEVPAQTYRPATAVTPTGISVAEVRLVPGKGAASDSARRDFVKLREKIGFPYAVIAFRVVFGDARMVYVTLYDSREKFFGANSLAALVEKAGAGADWQALGPRLLGTMDTGWTTKLWTYNPSLSYVPVQP